MPEGRGIPAVILVSNPRYIRCAQDFAQAFSANDAFKAFNNLVPHLQALVAEMVDVFQDPATADGDKQMAVSTIAAALFAERPRQTVRS